MKKKMVVEMELERNEEDLEKWLEFGAAAGHGRRRRDGWGRGSHRWRERERVEKFKRVREKKCRGVRFWREIES